MIDLLATEFIPVRLETDEHSHVARRLSVSWTPTLTVLHQRGATVRQWVGFLPSDAFVAELQLALALSELRSARADAAKARLDALAHARAAAFVRPEALYWKGVAVYRLSQDKTALWDVWRDLARHHPRSPWALRTTLLQPDWVEHPV